MKKIAADYFKNRKGNCAQAVADAWHRKTAPNDALIEELAGCGQGKAPEGLCGALHAIYRLVDKDSAERLAVHFREASGGHAKCREVRSAGKLTCVGCVEVAAELLDEHLTAMDAVYKS